VQGLVQYLSKKPAYYIYNVEYYTGNQQVGQQKDKMLYPATKLVIQFADCIADGFVHKALRGYRFIV
jgi:hypothetical protein